MKLRRRISLSAVLALAMAIIGSGSLVEPHITALRMRGPSPLPHTSVGDNLALGGSDAVSSDGLQSAVAALDTAQRAADSPIKSAPARFEGSAPRHVAPPAALGDSPVAAQSTRSPGTWAVVIGINDYPGTSNDLESAVNDADDVADALGTLGVESDHILELRDGQATSRTLLQSVSWLAAHAGPDAVAGFFYAGHVRKGTGGNEEIVTSDGSPVSDGQLAAALSHVQANRSWVAIAACFGGGFTEVLRPGRVLTAAADANSLAYENSALGRSYMVEYMVRQAIIQRRASATVQTAFNYAVDHLSREHPGREPVQYDDGDGVLDLRPPYAHTEQTSPESAPAGDQQSTQPPPADQPPSNGSGSSGQKCHNTGLFRYCTN